MADQDAELDLFRNGVNCAALLERLPPAWQLDRKGSTRGSLKYRRGAGEVVIVNHEGRGWWDPQGSAKGDIFDLVQFLDPGLNFGQVRQVLRPFVGLSPTYPEALRASKRSAPDRPLPARWAARPRLGRNSPAWRYLTEGRCLSVGLLAASDHADIVREGPYGSGWFAHRDETGTVTHIEIRGPDYRGSVRGGTKTLFSLPGGPRATRVAITEAPIDALSLASLEGLRADTLYVATGGGMGPRTEAAITAAALASIAASPHALLESATDADVAGDRYAARHAELAAALGIAFKRLRPFGGTDWNDVLKQRKAP